MLLVALLPVMFGAWNDQLVAVSSVFTFYLIFKIIYGLVLLGVIVFALMGKFARGNLLLTLIPVLLVQFVPLLLRLGIYMGSGALVYSILLSIISLLIFVAVFGLLVVSNKKQIRADVESESKTIPVVSEEISENRHKR